MGCNCKKNINKKYIEGELDFEEAYKISGFSKVVNAIFQFFFGLLISAILIVGIIPMLLYVIFSVCTGTNMSFKIPNLTKWLKK